MARVKPAAAPPSVNDLLLESLDTAFDKRSWHGTTLDGAARRVTAGQAARRVPGRKCVWEQVLHAAYWKHRVLTTLTKVRTRFPRKGRDWPPMPADQTAAAWKSDVELLRDLHRRLRAAVAALPPERLDPKTTWLVHGAAAHDLYHAGQIKLLRRLTGEE